MPPVDLLLLDNWQVTGYITDSQKGNLYKTWIAPLPDFDLDTFPFLVVSGRESFNLVNLKVRQMQILVQAPCKNHGAQEAFFFRKEGYGFTMHFCTKERTSENKDLHNWHSMPFKSDIIQKLKDFGCLPPSSLDEIYQLKEKSLPESDQVEHLQKMLL